MALTYVSNIWNLAYGPIQFRISEVLAVLPVFTPAAIPGLTIGCLIANIFSFNPIDMVFGAAASLIAAVDWCVFTLIPVGDLGARLLVRRYIPSALITVAFAFICRIVVNFARFREDSYERQL